MCINLNWELIYQMKFHSSVDPNAHSIANNEQSNQLYNSNLK